MELSLLARKTAVFCWLAIGTPGIVFAQANFVTNSGEYAIAGALPGDQLHPQASLNASGGFLVWEDNVSDGRGLGIGAVGLDSNFSAAQRAFRVNQIGADDQERPTVALLNGGGAVFAWQGGRQGFQHIYARFLSISNTWATGDVLVNTATNKSQRDPAMAALANGNVAVVWGSFNQQAADSLQDVYGQLFSPSGQKLGGEFAINQFTPFNQRTAALAALSGGGFVVVWVSEQQRSGPVDTSINTIFSQVPTNQASVDIYARLYDGNGSPLGDEFPVNTDNSVCAHPSVAAGSDGGFVVAWDQRDVQVPDNSLDIFARSFSSTGVGGSVLRVNTQLRGDQYAPRLSALGTDYLAVWTSLHQDGSREGVFGQFLHGDGSASGGEFRVNTTVLNSQIHPTVASDSSGRFLAVWSSFAGGVNSFDLYAQLYISPGFVPAAGITNYFGPSFSGVDPSGGSGSPGDPGSGNPPPTLDFPSQGAAGTNVPSNAFVLAQGSYNGLFYDPNGVTSFSSGYFSARATSRRGFSARVSLGNRTYSLSGQFDTNGAVTRIIARSGAPALTVHLQLDLTGGGQISGQISAGGWSAELLADKAKGARAGSYTLVIPPDTASANSPAGNGFGTVKVDAYGGVQWSGTLADGTKVTQTSGLSKQGIWPLYATLYGGSGSILSWIQFTSQPDSDLGGQLIWLKPRGMATASYRSGFTNEVEAVGSVYTHLSRARSLDLIFSGGGLLAPFTNSLSLNSNSRVAGLHSNGLTLNITTSSGLFRGSALNPDTGKALPFQGILFEKLNSGAGFFMNNNQSGEIYLPPAP